MRKLVFILGFFLLDLPIRANEIYIAQNSTGGGNGADCADARDDASLTAGDWTAGNTIHLCGTFTLPAGASNFLTVQGSGSSGNPITIKFEPNAVIQAPYFGGPVITLGTHGWITVDGGSNGLIQATANGTNLANHDDSGASGVQSSGGSNITVKNLTVGNLYVHVCVYPISNCTDELGGNTNGILIGGGSNITIDHNTLHDIKWAISYNMGGASTSNITISNNTEYNIDHGVFTTDGNNGNGAVMNGLFEFGNDWRGGGNWDDALDNFHHDCSHNDLSHGGTSAINVFIYNNYCHGDWGIDMSAMIYISSDTNPYSATIFNNLLVDESTKSRNGCGAVCSLSANTLVYNNTFVGQGGASGSPAGPGVNFYKPGNIAENNIFMGFYQATGKGGGNGAATYDNNVYYNIGTGGWVQNSFSKWQGWGNDVHGSNSNPNLNSKFLPSSASTAVVMRGTNLGSIVAGLMLPIGSDSSANGHTPVARPLSALCSVLGSTSCWDVGAYQANSSSASNPPNPPTGLAAIVQ